MSFFSLVYRSAEFRIGRQGKRFRLAAIRCIALKELIWNYTFFLGIVGSVVWKRTSVRQRLEIDLHWQSEGEKYLVSELVGSEFLNWRFSRLSRFSH